MEVIPGLYKNTKIIFARQNRRVTAKFLNIFKTRKAYPQRGENCDNNHGDTRQKNQYTNNLYPWGFYIIKSDGTILFISIFVKKRHRSALP